MPVSMSGDCLEGWFDCSEVGLGCIYPDLTDHDIDEVNIIIIIMIIS